MGVGRTSSTGLPWLVASSDLTNASDIIYPTSVVGSGVTLSGGQVSFSAAAAVSVNGCFTSAYDNYRIVVEGVQSIPNTVALRLRASGADATGSNYIYQILSGATTAAAAANYTATFFDYFSVGTTNVMVAEATIRRPNLAQTTLIAYQGGRETYVSIATGYHSLTTQYDGFSLIPTTGNLTGTVRIYGMRNY